MAISTTFNTGRIYLFMAAAAGVALVQMSSEANAGFKPKPPITLKRGSGPQMEAVTNCGQGHTNMGVSTTKRKALDKYVEAISKEIEERTKKGEFGPVSIKLVDPVTGRLSPNGEAIVLVPIGDASSFANAVGEHICRITDGNVIDVSKVPYDQLYALWSQYQVAQSNIGDDIHTRDHFKNSIVPLLEGIEPAQKLLAQGNNNAKMELPATNASGPTFLSPRELLNRALSTIAELRTDYPDRYGVLINDDNTVNQKTLTALEDKIAAAEKVRDRILVKHKAIAGKWPTHDAAASCFTDRYGRQDIALLAGNSSRFSNATTQDMANQLCAGVREDEGFFVVKGWKPPSR